MDIDFDALRQLFLSESAEALNRMEQALLALESQPGDSESLAEIFRIVHTLKGDAASVGYPGTAELSHHLEDLLEKLRSGEIVATQQIVTLLLRATDALRERLQHNSEEASDALTGPEQSLLVQLQAEVAKSSARSSRSAPASVPNQETPAPAGRRETTLRVDTSKLDQLLTLTGEIAVARGSLTQLLENPDTSQQEALEVHREAERLHLDVQELVTKLRMVPVGPTFYQYARTVRDLAREHGRQARLVVDGEEVEVDNSVLQSLKGPLTHMVRNALDHGIERPAERQRLGKSAEGTVTLRARHDAGNIVIELSDDGRGLDHDRILAQGRKLGRLGDDETPPIGRLHQLLLEPGFSTAEEVTDLGGRGVGMDVVRGCIESLRGSLMIDSRAGKGTTITIVLPLTLTIIEGLLVRVAGDTYILPLEPVVEVVELPADAGAEARPDGVAVLRDRTLPFFRLRHVFGAPAAAGHREIVVVARIAGIETGLVVDEVLGKGQTVIKPMPKSIRSLPVFSGSAILGDGQVALILNLPYLIQNVVGIGEQANLPSLATAPSAAPNYIQESQP